MASPMQGKWTLYGTENIEVFMGALPLPAAVRRALEQTRIYEDVHVNGDTVHVNIGVPTYEIPCYSKELNFHFGTEHDVSLPFGGMAHGSTTKVSDTKWVGKFQEKVHGECTITRELVNNEMWVTLETKGAKAIRKFERPCDHKCSDCPKTSPFQGKWKLYGSENFDNFMTAIGVPEGLKRLFQSVTICESIHVNGDNVHVKICIPSVVVPAHHHEIFWTFGQEHDLHLPFGHACRAKGKKESDTKWTATLTGGPMGETHLTREIRHGEMWVTFETPRGKCIRKFEKCEGKHCPVSCPK